MYRIHAFVPVLCTVAGIIPILLSPTAGAQPRPISFKHYDTRSGLTDYSVRSLAVDTQGFLWIGTQDGLNRFDGYTMKPFVHDSTDAGSLSGTYVHALHVDRSGTLWAGTGSGFIDRYDPLSERFVHHALAHSSPGDSATAPPMPQITSIVDDAGGNLWIGSSLGLFRLSNPDGDSSAAAVLLHATPVNDLLVDPGGHLIVAFATGLLGRLNPSLDLLGEARIVIEPLYLNDVNPIRSLAVAPAGDILAGGSDGLIYRFLSDDQNPPRVLDYGIDTPIFSLMIDRAGALWAGTRERGLHRIDPATGQHRSFMPDPTRPDAINHQNILALVEDRSGNIWAGTWRGLNRIAAGAFLFSTIDPKAALGRSASSGGVFAILEERPGVFLIGLDRAGILRYRLKAGRFERFSTGPPVVDASSITTLQRGVRGDLWIGSLEEGITVSPLDRPAHRSSPEMASAIAIQPDAAILKLLLDRSHRMWAGTNRAGVHRFSLEPEFVQKAFSHDATNSASLSSNYVATIFEDHAGTLWFGTANGGLCRYDDATDRFERFPLTASEAPVSAGHTVFAIDQIEPDRLWLGLKEGLMEFDTRDHSFVHYRIEDGLPHNTVLSIEVDDDRTLWMGTNNGLSHFDPATRHFTNYSEEDGIQGPIFHANASLKASDGRLLFGGAGGITIFDPAAISPIDEPAPLVLVDFEINNESADMGMAPPMLTSIDLRYDENFFRFTFASLDFTDPDRLRYRYKLENYDEEWIEKQDESRRFANYTKVEPGVYEMRVQATNSAGVWSPELRIPLTIHPPFWRRLWFRAAVLIALAGLVFSAHRYRLARQQEIHETRLAGMRDMEKLRMRIAGQLHDRVSANLSAIGLMAESITGRVDAPAPPGLLEKITRLARDSANSIRETSWVVNTGFDRLDKLVAALEDAGQDLLGDSIDFSFEQRSFIPDTPVTMDFRQNVYYLFREALHNIVKHAAAQRVDAFVALENGTFVLGIRDDGRGFDPSGVYESNGMVLFRRRARDLNGAVSIDTAPGRGTCITLTAPVEPARSRTLRKT